LQKIFKVRAQRMQIFPRFEDFDRIKNGFVTRNQFIRVLNDINLGSMLNETEMNCVLKKFSVRIGTRDDVNYVKFADTIYDLGSFEYRLP
jgi:Ca2+-binding EF-hand superfamily protein